MASINGTSSSPVASTANGAHTSNGTSMQPPSLRSQASIDLTGDDSSGEEVVETPKLGGSSIIPSPKASGSLSSSAQNARAPQDESSSVSLYAPSSSRLPFTIDQRPLAFNNDGIAYAGSGTQSPSASASFGTMPAGPNLAGFSQYKTQPSASGWTSGGSSSNHVNGNDSTSAFYANGTDASSAIDLTSRNVPSPPSVDEKKPLCIGSLRSNALMLYPCPAVVVGAQPPPGSKERYDLVMYRGVEFLKVKLKYRSAGTLARKDDSTSVLQRDTIQVLTPSLTTYVGDLDSRVAVHLANLMSRGLCRLEGFVPRLHPDAPQFQVRVDVLVFTLPSNVQYIANFLTGYNLFLLDPIPPYDPSRHSDHPPYHNGHGSGEAAMQLLAYAQRRAMGASGNAGSEFVFSDKEREKATQVEVQRKQVDEVFKSLDNGTELEQSDPGPLIKTDLFPHQRKALTFFLTREQDSSCLKQCKKAAKKALRKKRGHTADAEAEEEKTKGKEKKKDEEDGGNSLWEPVKDDRGKVRSWKNKITGEDFRGKKGKPTESKGALLADDMGLGKTLSVVSLIAATRSSAREYARAKLESIISTNETSDEESDIKAGDFKTRIFGMPSIDEQIAADTANKKRKRDDDLFKNLSARRSRITARSKATLLITPMSTIANWEDQIKEHWNGPVEIVGGASGVMPPKKIERKWKPPKGKGQDSSEDDDLENFDLLRVYIYHGPSRRPDPKFISEFDVVITSYNTLANEFSKQNGAYDTETNTPGETANNSGDEGAENKKILDSEIKPAEIAALMKSGKKGKGKARTGDQTSPLQAIDWFRVVLDEAHYIKTASTVASQAACYLEADRRIALSGTPIQNKIEDVWALFKFLRISPVDDKDVFTSYVSSPCKYGEQIGIARLQLVMRCCTLRRTKESTHEDGSKILNLPPRSERQMWLTLRDDERKIYDERANKAKDKFGELKANNEVSKMYVNMLQEVLRLRQICNHVDLAMEGPVEEDYDGTIMDYEVAVQGIERNGLTQPRAVAVVCSMKEGEGATCTSCGLDFGDWFPWVGLGGVEEEKEKPKVKKMPTKPLLTKCLHLYCLVCFKAQIYPEYSKRMKGTLARSCHCCNTMIRLPSDVIEVIPPDSADASEQAVAEQAPPKRAARKKYIRPPGEKLNLSTKMQFLHDELLRFSKKNPHSAHYDPFSLEGDDVEEMDAEGKPVVTKSIVFSQWTTMLDRIADMLDETNIRYARLDGTMTRDERSKAIDALKFKKNVEVLLVSTRAGGVGLNLTVASRCYLVDPYWNPSVESQAIDRIHRMGQTRPVVAIKLMIKDSIEEKLDKIQKKKAELAQLSLKNMSRKELMAQKVSDFQSDSLLHKANYMCY
ncbi:DNA repair protein RAD5 [Cryptococcus neoformans Bt63]|nr:DNA repair protein RAD5 [Cryptococcus neoformans var. grubii Bt63]